MSQLYFSKPAVINLVDETAKTELSKRLKEQEYAIIELNGEGVTNRGSFFEAFSQQLLKGKTPTNWSSFEDLFGNLIFEKEKEKTAFLWTSAGNMLQSNLGDFITCTDILISTSRHLYNKKLVHLNFLLGKGNNFPPPVWE